MASPRSPATVKPITITPGSRVLDVSIFSSKGRISNSDDSVWKRLNDAGLDEDSIRRRDKSALISYIAKLETEIYELQHNMGLLILERKDSASKYEEARLNAESAEAIHKRDQAALTSALTEARKREDNLKKALGVEKECVANIEKVLHEMRAECAEAKVAAESKAVEARSVAEDAQRKHSEAVIKLNAAESLQDEARRLERAAGRKLTEVEAREDDLRRQIVAFKADCGAKEKELMLERQSVVERQKALSEAQNKLLDGQALLNQREADIHSKSQALRQAEKELEVEKDNIAAERKNLMVQKSDLELTSFSLMEREKAVTEKADLLNKKEQEFLIAQEKLASKEQIEAQRIMAEQESILNRRRDEFESDLLAKQKAVEEEIERKKREWELRELDLKQQEDLIMEKEQDLEVQSRVIADKGKDLAEKMKSLEERESHINRCEVEIELTKNHLQKERREIDEVKTELENSLLSLERDKKQFAEAEKELELMKNETSELIIWEAKLKEEIDIIRAQKMELEAEAARLKVEKAKFESEWEFIDEKREELRREEEHIVGERLTISSFLKDERDSLNAEKVALREQYKSDRELLSQDKETFRTECQRERSEWFSKFQQERADFLLDVECRKRELEDSANKRREEIESYLKEKEKVFEEEMKRERQHISHLKEDLLREQELAGVELKKLEAEKLEIKLDREQRDKAWAELQSLIEELQMQRLKLKEQRELLHADREGIHSQIEHLKKLEDVKVVSDGIVVPAAQRACSEFTPEVIIRVPRSESTQKVSCAEERNEVESDSPPGSTVSWLKKCASLIFKNPADRAPTNDVEASLEPECEVDGLGPSQKEVTGLNNITSSEQGMQIESVHVTRVESVYQYVSEEPKVIHEVPSTGEDAMDATKCVHESSIPASGISVGRKRRVDDSNAPEIDVAPLNDGKNNKKRRQKAIDVPEGSEDAAPQGMYFNQTTVTEDQHVSYSSRVDTTEERAVDISNKVDGGTCEVVEGEASRCVTLEQTTIQEVLVDGGESNKYHGEVVASDPKEQEVKEAQEKPELDKVETVKEGVRTRSRTK